MAWLCADIDDQVKSIVCMLFVESMRLGCAGSKTSPGHGSLVLATIRQACMSCNTG